MIPMMEINNTDITTWALPQNAIARLGRGRAKKVAFSPDSTHLVVATSIGLWWYELATMQPVALWETERGMVSAVAFSDDGQWIATGNLDGVVNVQTFWGHSSDVQDLAFSPDGTLLASAGFDGAILLWDMNCQIKKNMLTPLKQEFL